MTPQQLHLILAMTFKHCHLSPVLSAQLYARAIEQISAIYPIKEEPSADD